MKICIDIQSIITSPAGVGRYTYQLVKALAGQELPPEMEINLSYFDFKRRYDGSPVAYDKFAAKGIRWMPGRFYNYLWKKFHFPPLNWLLGNYDVYHFTNFALPPMSRGKFVVSVHDLGFVRYPQYIEPKNLAFLRAELPRSLRRADRIITISKFTKQELMELFRVPEEKIAVTYMGMDERFRRMEDPEVRKRYNLPPLYVLHVGTLEPRKNIEGLLRAFRLCRLADYKLVLAGGRGWLYGEIFRLVKELNLAERVMFLGYVQEEDLPAIYSMARLFVFPSFYEGFGMPPIEAMACGVPVVAARGSSLSEVLADAVRFIDPYQPEDIAAGIEDCLRNREIYISKGKEKVKQYSWARTARETLNVYLSL